MSTAPKKINFKKGSFKKVNEKGEEKTEDKADNKQEIDSTFVLRDLNRISLDRNYLLPDISKVQERASHDKERKDIRDEGEDTRNITTSLEKLGISTAKKESLETICWGDNYKIQLFVNEGTSRFELTTEKSRRLKCTWCHMIPPTGTLMLAVPFKFVPSCIEEQVYAPECINIVQAINVEPSKSLSSDKNPKKLDLKSVPKINNFKRSLTSSEITRYRTDDQRVHKHGYFECAKVVCSFNCMVSKGKEMAQIDPRFRNVNMHITSLYFQIFGHMPGKITPASPFDILEEYGGSYTTDEYRKNFKFITISDTNQYYSKASELIRSSVALYALAQEDN